MKSFVKAFILIVVTALCSCELAVPDAAEDAETIMTPETDPISSPGVHSVIYEGNGYDSGAVPEDPEAYGAGQLVTVLAPGNLARTGHVFHGWNDQADGKGTNHEPGSTIEMGTDDIVLSAVWTPQQCTVSFNSAGGSSVAAAILPYGTVLTLPQSPSRIGYVFAGWFMDPQYVHGWQSAPVTSSFTLHAKWKVPFAMKEYLRDGARASGQLGSPDYGIFFNGNGTAYASSVAIHDTLQSNASKPIVVSIHGLDGYGPVNYFDNGKAFANWTCFSFRWANVAQFPEDYGKHGWYLFSQLKDMVETYNIHDTEIRLMGHSWGSHTAAYAARLLVDHLKTRQRRILVSVTLLDPVMQHQWLAETVCTNLVAVQEGQTGVGIIARKKLFTILVSADYYWLWDGFYFFSSRVLPSISQSSELFIKNTDHGGVSTAPRTNESRFFCGTYRRFDEVKVDLSKTSYASGDPIIGIAIYPWHMNGMVKRDHITWDGNREVWIPVPITQ